MLIHSIFNIVVMVGVLYVFSVRMNPRETKAMLFVRFFKRNIMDKVFFLFLT